MSETTEKSAFLRGKIAITPRLLKGVPFLGVSSGGVGMIATGFMPQNQLKPPFSAAFRAFPVLENCKRNPRATTVQPGIREKCV